MTYVKNLLWFVPPWLLYVGCMIYGVEPVGFWLSMAGSMVLYMGCVGLVKLLARQLMNAFAANHPSHP